MTEAESILFVSKTNLQSMNLTKNQPTFLKLSQLLFFLIGVHPMQG